MGVSGAGKSSVAAPLARRWGWTFLEGDDLHPPANIAAMSQGIALGDADRLPWLAAVAAAITAEHAAGRSVVVTCSALRRSYRDLLRAADPAAVFVHLHGDPGMIASRMRTRQHFMGPAMLDSQLASLEPLAPDEGGIEVDLGTSRAEIAQRVLARLSGGDPPTV